MTFSLQDVFVIIAKIVTEYGPDIAFSTGVLLIIIIFRKITKVIERKQKSTFFHNIPLPPCSTEIFKGTLCVMYKNKNHLFNCGFIVKDCKSGFTSFTYQSLMSLLLRLDEEVNGRIPLRADVATAAIIFRYDPFTIKRSDNYVNYIIVNVKNSTVFRGENVEDALHYITREGLRHSSLPITDQTTTPMPATQPPANQVRPKSYGAGKWRLDVG